MNRSLISEYKTCTTAVVEKCFRTIRLICCSRIPFLIVIAVLLVASSNRQTFAQFDGSVAFTAGKNQDLGRVSSVLWNADCNRVSFKSNGQRFVADLRSMKIAKQMLEEEAFKRQSLSSLSMSTPIQPNALGSATSPSGRWIATSENGNVFIKDLTTGSQSQVTNDGAARISNGLPSVDLEKEMPFVPRTGVWWTDDEAHLLYAKFDSTRVKQYFLTEKFSKIDPTIRAIDRESPGSPLSTVQFSLFELNSKTSTRLRIDEGTAGHVFDIRKAPGGQLICSWTNREYTHRKELLINSDRASVETIVEVKHDKPLARGFWRGEKLWFLNDNDRFLWLSNDSGNRHYELRNLEGRLISRVTKGAWDVDEIVFVDEKTGLIGFTAYSSSINPYFRQFHIASLDGTKSWRVTKRELNHSSFQISPDHRWLISTCEGPDTPPCTWLSSMDGTKTLLLAERNPREAAHIAETFKFRSSDGGHDIHGILYKPLDYDPACKYPVIAMPYGLRGGPTWWPDYVGNPLAINTGKEFQYNRSYIILQVNNRGTMFRGRDFVDAAYGRLLTVCAQDYADAVRSLQGRTDIDFERVGIVGTSFGGGVACLAVLQHPDVFLAGISKAGVMDWRNQAAVATVRFGMGLFNENSDSYKNDSPVAHAHKLKRPLLLMQGMLDTRVLPNSVFLMSDALDQADLDYEMKLYPNSKHTVQPVGLSGQWKFFKKHLIDR